MTGSHHFGRVAGPNTQGNKFPPASLSTAVLQRRALHSSSSLVCYINEASSIEILLTMIVVEIAIKLQQVALRKGLGWIL
jgi:hypothetical protein